MLNIEITETKNFVKKLLMEPVFDTFLLWKPMSVPTFLIRLTAD